MPTSCSESDYKTVSRPEACFAASTASACVCVCTANVCVFTWHLHAWLEIIDK